MWNRPENQVKLIMIRHAATKSNGEHRYLGRTDEGLTEESLRRLKAAREKEQYPEADIVFTSPMKRCLETARVLYPELQPIQIPEWVEMDFGDFEGKNYIDLKDDRRYQAWIDSNGILPFPNGESREAFIRRSCSGLEKMIKLLEQRKDTVTTVNSVAVIVHGGTIMSLLSSYHGGEYFDYQVPNGSGYICMLKYEKNGLKITEPGRLHLEW